MVATNDIEHARLGGYDEKPTIGTYYTERVTKYLLEVLENPVFSFQYDGRDKLNKETYLTTLDNLLACYDNEGNLSSGEIPSDDNGDLGQTTHIFIKEILPEPTSRGSLRGIQLEKMGGMDVALGFLIETCKTYDDTIKEANHEDKIITFKKRDFTDDDIIKKFYNLWYALFQIEKEADEQRRRFSGK